MRIRRASGVLVVAAVAASCGADGGTADVRSSPTAGSVTVFAASSLTAAFTDIGDAFEDSNPDIDVTFSFAGSSELVAQIEQGAPVDVFASADLVNMDRLVETGDAGDVDVFATNVLEIIVEADNPLGISSIADLADSDLVVVQCAPDVPCGRYAAQVLDDADVDVTPKSLEGSVNAVVTKVTLGEADAGIVYRTDVSAAAGRASGVAIDDDVNVVADYPIATVQTGPDPSGAQAFVDFVLGSDGQGILAGYGFGPP